MISLNNTNNARVISGGSHITQLSYSDTIATLLVFINIYTQIDSMINHNNTTM